MIALGRPERLTHAAILAIAVAASCAEAENSPLADRGGDDDGGGRGGSAGSGMTGGSSGSTSTGGTAGKGGGAAGGSAGKGGTTSTGGKGGSNTGGSSTGGSGGSTPTTYGCKSDGEGGAGGEGGASGGAPAGGGGGVGPETLFLDDFEDGNADGWAPTSGSWSIVSDDTDVYQQTDGSSTSQYVSAVTGTCWDDQIVEARVKIVNFNGNSTSNAAGVFARYVSAQTHYLVGMDSGNNGELFIGRRIQSTSNMPDRVVTKTNMRWATNTWYTLRLEVVGSSLKAYLNDTLELETTDAQITSGGVAVGARRVNVRFDDVKVTTP